MRRIISVAILLSALTGPLTFAQTASDSIYIAIRNNDLPALRALIKDSGADLKDSRGQTPLMIAAAFGSLDAMSSW
jgi:ankyrin repeat protein